MVATLTSPNATAGGTAQSQQGSAAASPVSVVPFIRASQEHREAALDVSRLQTASDQDLGAFPIPAYGFLRAICLLVQATGSSVSGTTVTADAPFAAIKNITLAEPNGAVIYQANSGYDAYLIHKYGGYRGNNDPRAHPAYAINAAASLNYSFFLRIPLEINLRDALGSLPNQNAAATFILRITLAAYTALATGGTVTTAPTVRIRAWSEEWDQPAISGEAGQNETTPPAMNTTQFWSVQQYPVTVGNINIRLTRLGNYLRNILVYFRDGSNARVSQLSANWPNPLTLYWDTRPQDVLEVNNWLGQIYERYGYSPIAPGGGAVAYDTANGLDTGVMSYDFCHEFDGSVGMELRDLWLPTLGSTRLELGGSFGVAGTLYVLTNDVSVAGNVFV